MSSSPCRKFIIFCFVVALTPTCLASEDNLLEKLVCIHSCYRISRKCAELPDRCGGCTDGHVEVDGVCRPKTIDMAERDLEVQERILGQITREKRKQETDDNANDIETEGMNLNRRDESSGGDTWGDNVILIAVVAALCSAAVVGVVVALICWCMMKKSVKDISEAGDPYENSEKLKKNSSGSLDYPAYPPAVDRKLAQSAQMYHYQHQKQQMLELERAQEYASKSDGEGSTDEDNPDDQYTVYECPGLANTGEMEVRNPLYSESPLPSSSPPPPPSTSPPPLDTPRQHTPSENHLVNGH